MRTKKKAPLFVCFFVDKKMNKNFPTPFYELKGTINLLVLIQRLLFLPIFTKAMFVKIYFMIKMFSLFFLVSALSLEVSSRDVVCGSGLNICDPKLKLRLYDGSCNNIQNPKWGSVSSMYTRLLEAKYDDGKSEKCFSIFSKLHVSVKALHHNSDMRKHAYAVFHYYSIIFMFWQS